jgi:hypothetical protein
VVGKDECSKKSETVSSEEKAANLTEGIENES